MNRVTRSALIEDVLAACAWYREQNPDNCAPLVLQVAECILPRLAEALDVSVEELRAKLAAGFVVVPVPFRGHGMRVELVQLPGDMHMRAVPLEAV